MLTGRQTQEYPSMSHSPRLAASPGRPFGRMALAHKWSWRLIALMGYVGLARAAWRYAHGAEPFPGMTGAEGAEFVFAAALALSVSISLALSATRGTRWLLGMRLRASDSPEGPLHLGLMAAAAALPTLALALSAGTFAPDHLVLPLRVLAALSVLPAMGFAVLACVRLGRGRRTCE